MDERGSCSSRRPRSWGEVIAAIDAARGDDPNLLIAIDPGDL
jgi:hypothetical protein